ncbi:MAG: cyclic nucleotide-binding domain-containing protein [Actinomycetota bacterium]|nr:cyclic nucleotide-binding domain-containing protein [Actinomycetota bacterium]
MSDNSLPSKIERLRSIWLFAECSKKELQLLERACDEASAKAGTIICEEGHFGRDFYMITSGSAKVSKGGNEVARLEASDHFGELALLDHQPRSATVTAVTDVELLVLPAREFTSVLEEIPTMAIRLLATMAAQLRRADEAAYE